MTLRWCLAVVAVFCGLPHVLWSAEPARSPQLTPDEAAVAMLDAARRAFNEGKHDVAIARFREFIEKHRGHREAPAAHYGLGLALWESPKRDLRGAIAVLQQATAPHGNQPPQYAELPMAHYYLGAVHRELGIQASEQTPSSPQEAEHLRNEARTQFAEAEKRFAAAAAVMAKRHGGKDAADEDAAMASEWLVRAKCDQCEMLLRTEKYREARRLAESVIEDKAVGPGALRAAALYHAGHASFMLKEYAAAGRALSQLAPFRQPFGAHARYLLARCHHLAEEPIEASDLYKAVLTDFEQQRKTASELLRTKGGRMSADEKRRHEALAKGKLPEYAMRAMFYAALLAAENGRYGEAAEGFAALEKQFPQSALGDEAQLRRGYCQLQMRNYAESIKLLTPLAEHPQLADRALWWLGKAQAGSADPTKREAFEQAVAAALATLQRAADRANQMAARDPDARLRRADILMDLGDALQAAGKHRDAAGVYHRVIEEKLSADRAEEAMQRQATALSLAGMHRESDDVCARFEKAHPTSTLLAAVLFRAAENARMLALASAQDPNMRSRKTDLAALYSSATKRYGRFLEKYPDSVLAPAARHGLATLQYQTEQYADALATLQQIPTDKRTGDLAAVPYLMADCLLRVMPAHSDDAVQAAEIVEQSKRAAKLLEGFLGTHAKSPQAGDAYLKLGFCYQRIGTQLSGQAERQAALTQAKATYDRLQRELPKDGAVPAALFEKARCMSLLGDTENAIRELSRFQNDPLRTTTFAPLAIIRLGSMLRVQNRAAEAAQNLGGYRGKHEGDLLRDAERAVWVPVLQYEHGLALKESGKPHEARLLFEALAKQFPLTAEAANAAWRTGECRREEVAAAMQLARKAGQPGLKPEDVAAAQRVLAEAPNALRHVAEEFEKQAATYAKKPSGGELQRRLLYEAAWCYRALGDLELEASRQKLRGQALDKFRANWSKVQKGRSAPTVAPDVPVADAPVTAGEKAALRVYAALLALGGDPTLIARARLELAEIHLLRSEDELGVDLLSGALELNPPEELAERIELRLAGVLIERGDATAALKRAKSVLKRPKSPHAAEARYLAGEACIRAKDWPQAVEHLVAFRDQDPWRRAHEVADRALLRLGTAYAEMHNWPECQRTIGELMQRYAGSPWIHEARFAMAQAQEGMKQYDQAVNTYNEVTRATAAQVAAKAQLQIGRCRMAQKRAQEAAKELELVSLTYDYPDASAAALYEAGLAYVELKQPGEAQKVWKSVAERHGTTPWAELAKKQLADLAGT